MNINTKLKNPKGRTGNESRFFVFFKKIFPSGVGKNNILLGLPTLLPSDRVKHFVMRSQGKIAQNFVV